MCKENKVYVKPCDGKLVNIPEHNNRVLPPEGAWVPNTQFWLRRLRDEDVEEAKPPLKKKTSAPSTTTD